MIKSINKLRTKLEENDSSNDIRNLLEEIHDVDRHLEALEHTRSQLLIAYETATEELSQLQQKIDHLKERVIGSRKTKNVYAIANKVMLLSTDFRQIQTRKKLQQVEISVTHMLNELFRKEMFIVRVVINPETFDMSLYNDSNDEINKEILSAGEKHILLLSTIWAMVTLSGRKIPFVFDTLLGRLDQKHKERIINHFIPLCGDQVILLSTDSEIDGEHFEYIKRRVTKSYTIDHDVRRSRIQVLPDTYFSYSLMAEADYEL
jgi:DNA sulfur modification protein DndD